MNKLDQDEITEGFYKYQVWYFKMLGIWKLHPFATRQQFWLQQLRFGVIFGIIFTMLLFFSIRLLGNIANLHIIIQVFFMFATEVSCMTKLLILRLKQKKHAQLIEGMHDSVFQPSTDQETLILKKAAWLVNKLRNIYGILCLNAAGLILVSQWFVDSIILPVSMYEPCDVTTANCYYVLYLYQIVSIMPTCWLNIAFDTVVPSMLMFLESQLAILVLRLENLGTALTPQDNQRITSELRECCIYYGRLVQLKDSMENFIKVPGSVQLLCSVLVLVSNFYDLSTTTDELFFVIRTALYQFAMLLQIFIICYAANKVTNQSSLLCHALYKSDWTTWNKKNRKMCLLMMLRFNSPLYIRTINHTQSFSLTTFSAIVNTSYSYFALLKRINN